MEFIRNNNWGTTKKILFRIACLYILIYSLPTPYTYIPGVSYVAQYLDSFWNAAGIWFGQSIVGLEGEIRTMPNGSGDRLINYLRVAVYLLVSLGGTFIWTLIDRNRKNYRSMVYWIRLHVRYYLFSILFFYGIVKVIKSQFPFPSLTRLIEPLGDFSPMGLAWTFMGYSDTYTIFAGLMEIVAALLLLFRRTTTLGAMIATGVMWST